MTVALWSTVNKMHFLLLKISSVGREASAEQVKCGYWQAFYGNIERMSGRLPQESDISAKTEILVELARGMLHPMEGVPCAKPEKGGRTGNIPETAEWEVQRDMGAGMLKKGGWRSKKGSEHKRPLRVYKYVLPVSAQQLIIEVLKFCFCFNLLK